MSAFILACTIAILLMNTGFFVFWRNTYKDQKKVQRVLDDNEETIADLGWTIRNMRDDHQQALRAADRRRRYLERQLCDSRKHKSKHRHSARIERITIEGIKAMKDPKPKHIAAILSQSTQAMAQLDEIERAQSPVVLDLEDAKDNIMTTGDSVMSSADRMARKMLGM